MGGPIVAAVPARFSSTRFPGKPLVDLKGRPMIVRVAERARSAISIDRVIVATDDDRIAEVVHAHGFEAIMTPSELPSGTDRIAHALDAANIEAELVVNVQGDEPLIDPADIDVLVEAMADKEMGTLAREIADEGMFADPNVVKVVVDDASDALYFSRAPIPHRRGDGESSQLGLQHIGLYAYRRATLSRLVELPECPLEKIERLEQLRALFHNISIHVAMARSAVPSIAVDTPEDVERVLRAISESES